MADFLLELFSEEIPARMQARACDDLARLFNEQMADAGLKAGAVETYATPRRLALIARALPTETEAVREERRGPRADAPEQALAGFLKSTGLTRDQLEERDDPKGRFLYAVIEKPGRRTADVLAEAVPEIVRAFPWPKSMRWGRASQSTASMRWVRPLKSVIALLDGEEVNVAIDGVPAGSTTLGHRFHHPDQVTIGSADDYAAKLRACHVILDPAERRRIIAEKAEALASAAGLELVPDEGLLAENAGLTEWPVPLLGSFDPAFLEVPPEVIQLTMRVNQKYFALIDVSTGKLAPNFICVANIDAKDGGKAIVAGNEKVLAARLADAKFFWEQDRKTKLADFAGKLDQIVFHEKLGTVADKVERVAKLARWLVEEGVVQSSVTPAQAGGHEHGGSGSENAVSMDSRLRGNDGERARLADMAEQAARLAKADLVTGMVGEFPELQGVMGGYYARAEGLPDEVADAIRDHYKPVGQGDEVPTAPVTVAVSLADKLDALLGFFIEQMPPTGSKDPFALRRAALAVLQITMEGGLRYSLEDVLLGSGYQYYLQTRQKKGQAIFAEVYHGLAEAYGTTPSKSKLDDLIELRALEINDSPILETHFEAITTLVDFFADRLKVQQREAGVRHDLIDAVFALGGEDDLVRLLARVKALQSFIATDDGANLLAGYKRAANILKIEEKKGGLEETGEYRLEPAEDTLIDALDLAETEARAAVEAEDFERAMAALSRLRAPIDAFFDEVTVNDERPHVRAARLRLLGRIREAVHAVADFSRIEG
ncbi:glycine--tRNA ligase subunit beta [Tardibacter chloracetimidivorans]|uniref:Glycine--tRNA ligase beta subunit n=1 Tax=Tardibacter chloracetimidivorans TaxID=1921510 RepID=A0A1L3ZRQ9_9SPHN|nr:glycine--tRNA ligase subunit beta [Tardibacter chloracetimidivorans]API58317.1 glycine--tRNA ligase subunit beta [Tardibacter chloracetimidivorans]